MRTPQEVTTEVGQDFTEGPVSRSLGPFRQVFDNRTSPYIPLVKAMQLGADVGMSCLHEGLANTTRGIEENDKSLIRGGVVMLVLSPMVFAVLPLAGLAGNLSEKILYRCRLRGQKP